MAFGQGLGNLNSQFNAHLKDEFKNIKEESKKKESKKEEKTK